MNPWRIAIVVPCLAVPAAADDLEKVVEALALQLEDERWEVREEATRRLASMLPDALPWLVQAARSGGPETRDRIASILDSIRIDDLGRLRQWASTSSASSEYGSDSWSALQATGEPDTPEPGDQQTAWASRDPDRGEETLLLGFPHPVHAVAVRIHETYNPGAVVRIETPDGRGGWTALWSGRDPTAAPAGVFEVPLAATEQPIRELRVVLDTSLVTSWNEIDAVELVGEPPPAPPRDEPDPDDAIREAIARKKAERDGLAESLRRIDEEIRELETSIGK